MTPAEKDPQRRPQAEDRRPRVTHQADPEKERQRRNERASLLRTKNRVKAARFR